MSPIMWLALFIFIALSFYCLLLMVVSQLSPCSAPLRFQANNVWLW